MTQPILPADLFTLEDHQTPASAWQSLQEQSADARVKRTDLIGVLAMEELAAGKYGYRERVQLRLADEGQEPVSTKVIGDGEKIFRLFRLGGDQGFGWTASELARYQPGRLRTFAQNMPWALKNRDRVEEMLRSGINENDMRDMVREAIAAEKGGRTESTEVWESLKLRLEPVQMRILKGVLAGLRVKREQTAGEVFSDTASTALGQVIFALAAEWLEQDETYSDGENGDVIIANRSFVDPGLLAEIEELMAAEQAESGEEDADDDAA